MSALTKLPPAWHAVVAAELNKDFVEIDALEMSARKRRAYLGLKFHYVKERGKADDSIPFGTFEDWMAKHCSSIPDRTYRRYMNEAKSVCERMGWQIGQIGRFEIPPHKLLELPASQVPAKEQKAQQLLLDLVEARGKFQPVTEYKQLDRDGNTLRGQTKGSKGCTKEMRLKAKYANDQEMLVATKSWMDETADQLMQNVGVSRAARVDEIAGGAATLRKFTDAVAYAHSFLQNLKPSRGTK